MNKLLWLRTTMILLLGAGPATILLPFALLLTVDSVQTLFEGFEPYILVLLSWGFASVWGTIALWQGVIGKVSGYTCLGLCVGIGALSPLTYIALTGFMLFDMPLLFGFCVGPSLVGVYLLFEAGIRRLPDNFWLVRADEK